MSDLVVIDNEKPDTFWGRVKQAFSKNEYGEIRPEIAHIPVVVFCGSLVGMMVGGRHGVRIRGASNIATNKLTVYTSTVQAHRDYFSAILLGFFHYGCRWGWRAGLYSGIYSTTLTVLSIGREKEDSLNYIVAGATTGTIYKIFSGFRGIFVGAILGAGICTPIGLTMQALGHFIPYEKVLKDEIAAANAKEKEKLEATGKILDRIQKELESSENI